MSELASDDAFAMQSRPDVVAQEQRRRGKRVWIIKDPIAMAYHQLGDEEYGLLQLLDGRASLTAIKRSFEQTFAPRKISTREIQSLAGVLHRKGLVLPIASGQGAALLARRRDVERRKWLSRIANPLAIRFRGLDPDRLLDRIYPNVRFLFSPIVGFFCWLLILSALGFAIVRFGELQSKLPGLNEYLTATNLLWLSVCLGVVKVVHELGHAFACKHYGGECHEIGFMLLVFTPALYCDVSDTWLIESKWKRAAVAAAGIFVELVIASACFFLWWYSQPGLFNTICFNVVLIASVSTLLINGNPLLRYDGYFILSDVIESPNLWQTSRDCLSSWMRQVCLGVVAHSDALLVRAGGNPFALVGYAIASNVYRFMVVGAILLTLNTILRPLGLAVVAQLLAVMVVGAMVATPLYRFRQFISNPSNRRDIRPKRLLVTGGVGLVLLLLFFAAPLPYRVAAPTVLEPRDAQRIYAPVDSTLRWTARDGERIAQGDVALRLEAPELLRELQRLAGELARQSKQLDNLQTLRADDPESSARIPAAREAVNDLRSRMQLQRSLVDGLVLKAERDGVLRAAPARIETTDRGELPAWNGNLLDPRNEGAFTPRGELLAYVVEDGSWDAVLFVDQSEIEFVAVGQAVRVDLDQTGLLYGTVASIAEVEADSIPSSLQSRLAFDRVDGQLRPRDTLYRVRVTLDTSDHLAIHAPGRAKVLVAGQSLGYRCWRALRKAFSSQVY